MTNENLAETIMITVVDSKVSLVGSEMDWVVDIRATKHICGFKVSTPLMSL